MEPKEREVGFEEIIFAAGWVTGNLLERHISGSRLVFCLPI
jgi:hypothetical protein